MDQDLGVQSAKYEYSPFGSIFLNDGFDSKSKLMRFSTTYYDDESGFSYYGHRYYNPSTAKWLSRDPAEEGGSLNLFGFVGNSPIGNWDYLGLAYGEHLTAEEAKQLACAIKWWLGDFGWANSLLLWGGWGSDRSLTYAFLKRYMSKEGGILTVPFNEVEDEPGIAWGNAEALKKLSGGLAQQGHNPKPIHLNPVDNRFLRLDLKTSFGRVLLHYSIDARGTIVGEIMDHYTFADTTEKQSNLSVTFPLLSFEGGGRCCWKGGNVIRDYWMWDLERYGFAKSFHSYTRWEVTK